MSINLNLKTNHFTSTTCAVTLPRLKICNEASSSGVFFTTRHAVHVAARQTAACLLPGSKTKEGKELNAAQEPSTAESPLPAA